MTLSFTKATKKQSKLRLAVEGPAGYGKSYSALAIASGLIDEGQRIAAVDTEGRSLSLYADRFPFDVIELDPPFHPRRFVAAIKAAEDAGYGAIILDSLSHAWTGQGGTLDIVEDLAKTKYRGDSHAAWREGTAIQTELVDAVLRSKIHVLATMRTKADYVREEVERDGRTKTIIRKAGTKTIQRDEFDYEFTIVGRFDVPEAMTVIKSRYDGLPPETIIKKPGAEFAKMLRAWLESGEIAQVQPTAPLGNAATSEELRERAAREAHPVLAHLTDDSGAMDGTARVIVDERRLSAAQEDKDRAVAKLKEWGFVNWAGFFAEGTNLQAAELLAVLDASKEEVTA